MQVGGSWRGGARQRWSCWRCCCAASLARAAGATAELPSLYIGVRGSCSHRGRPAMPAPPVSCRKADGQGPAKDEAVPWDEEEIYAFLLDYYSGEPPAAAGGGGWVGGWGVGGGGAGGGGRGHEQVWVHQLFGGPTILELMLECTLPAHACPDAPLALSACPGRRRGRRQRQQQRRRQPASGLGGRCAAGGRGGWLHVRCAAQVRAVRAAQVRVTPFVRRLMPTGGAASALRLLLAPLSTRRTFNS